MGPIRPVTAVFLGATPQRDGERCGLALSFRPLRARLGVDRIEDFADLGPDHTVESVHGLGKVLRLLRAARLARPPDPVSLLGEEVEAAARLDRARGVQLRLQVRARSRLRFRAWTESGVRTVNDVVDVVEGPFAWLVMRRHGRFPVNVPRDAVVRQRTETERWYEVVQIERA